MLLFQHAAEMLLGKCRPLILWVCQASVQTSNLMQPSCGLHANLRVLQPEEMDNKDTLFGQSSTRQPRGGNKKSSASVLIRLATIFCMIKQ